jgi:UDP-N-acetylglucosamine diphosphorylase / glucose-1-phosphate thymidylyltransferase / UDP-N-acetylgalactosamine diphosphorylase / glucosamine-1-phosphate N-acetyltransferase / galactosamine-1-phosphate N-acetyltransferase
MKDLETASFFSLDGYAHAALFKQSLYPWEALTRIESYLKSYPLGRIEVTLSPSVFLVNPETISIGRGTRVEAGAYIAGPCIIGEECEIRQGAYIRGNVITGNRCVIGHATEVKNALFLNQVRAAHFNYVGDSLLGNRVNLGAGVICANYRLDHEEIYLVFNGKKILTGLKKFGAVVGDGSQLGCHSVLNPGTLIGKAVLCYPSMNISGHIRDGSIIK